MKAKLSEITDAIEMADPESEYFLDKETGEIVWISDFAMTSKEYQRLKAGFLLPFKIPFFANPSAPAI